MTRFVDCAGCGRTMEDEGLPTCVECEIHESDDCPACGSQMASDRFCSCDINSPPLRHDVPEPGVIATEALSSPGEVMQQLEVIEREMAIRQNPLEKAAGDTDRYTKMWDARLAYCALRAKGENAEKRKAHAFVMAIEEDEGVLWNQFIEASSAFSAMNKAQYSSEKRASIKQSILKGQGRG